MDKLEEIRKKYRFYQKVYRVLYKNPKRNKKLIRIINQYMIFCEKDYNYYLRTRRSELLK